MTEQQIPKLAAVLVEHQDCFSELSTEDAQWAIQNPKKAIALYVEAIAKRPNLLDLVGTVEIPALGEFIARDRFVVNNKAELPIFYLGTNFEDWFLGKVEEPAGESVLRCQRLHRAENNSPIIAELGGNDRAEITLGQLYAFLKQADKSKWYICYVCDKNGVLCAVYADWGGGGWGVHAGSVEDPRGWREGGIVLSPQF